MLFICSNFQEYGKEWRRSVWTSMTSIIYFPAQLSSPPFFPEVWSYHRRYGLQGDSTHRGNSTTTLPFLNVIWNYVHHVSCFLSCRKRHKKKKKRREKKSYFMFVYCNSFTELYLVCLCGRCSNTNVSHRIVNFNYATSTNNIPVFEIPTK